MSIWPPRTASAITLGVENLERSIRFYQDGLELKRSNDGSEISFFKMGGTISSFKAAMYLTGLFLTGVIRLSNLTSTIVNRCRPDSHRGQNGREEAFPGPEYTVTTMPGEQVPLNKLVANWRTLIHQWLAATEASLFVGR